MSMKEALTMPAGIATVEEPRRHNLCSGELEELAEISPAFRTLAMDQGSCYTGTNSIRHRDEQPAVIDRRYSRKKPAGLAFVPVRGGD